MTPTLPARLRAPCLNALVAAGCLVAGSAHSGQIFTCVDSQGRRITADRPIMECLDREQRELTPSGSLKRVVPPSYTAQERAEVDAKQKAAEAEQAQAKEAQRRLRALQLRYPTPATHDKARADALQQAEQATEAVRAHSQELDREQQKLTDEMAFYKNAPKKAPAWLKNRQEDNAQRRAKVAMELADKERERTQIKARFDNEREMLRPLWDNTSDR